MTSWVYDAAYRLTGQQQSGAAATFVYDQASNILSKQQQDGNPPLTMVYDPANQITTILQGSALTTVTFDNTGNMTGQNTDGALTTFTFDNEDRLTGIASSFGVSTYTSDGDGLRRSAFEAGGVLTTFVWEGSDYLMEKTPSGTQARYAVIEGEVVTEKRSGVRRLYVPDPLGCTRGLIDNTQTQTDAFAFWPYGESQSRAGSTTTPFQFVGTLGYHLDLSGLVYVRARYLDVVRGRWMTRDPVGPEVGGGYQYARNAPATVIDPSGRQPASGLSRCRHMSPGACFWCVYNYWRGRGVDPGEACLLANHYCGSHVDCGGQILPPPVCVPPPQPREYTCTKRCGCDGKTPPCGYYVTGTATGETMQKACAEANRVACAQCEQPPCHCHHCH